MSVFEQRWGNISGKRQWKKWNSKNGKSLMLLSQKMTNDTEFNFKLYYSVIIIIKFIPPFILFSFIVHFKNYLFSAINPAFSKDWKIWMTLVSPWILFDIECCSVNKVKYRTDFIFELQSLVCDSYDFHNYLQILILMKFYGK